MRPLQQVDVIYLDGLASSRWPHPVIDVADPVDDVIWPLPLGQELELSGRDEDEYLVPWV